MFELTGIEFAIACGIAMLGALVQTSIGFGSAIVSAPILFLINPSFVPGVVVITTAVNGLFMMIYYRADLSVSALTPALITRVPGSLCGAVLLSMLSPKLLAVVIAIAIAIAIVASYLRLPLALNRRNLAIAGFVSGLMGTATAIGGPPVAILMQGQAANHIRSQLAAFFLFSALVTLIILTLTGQMQGPEWIMSIPLLLPVLVGSWLGVKVGKRLPEEGMRKAALVVCVIAVTTMLARTLF